MKNLLDLNSFENKKEENDNKINLFLFILGFFLMTILIYSSQI